MAQTKIEWSLRYPRAVLRAILADADAARTKADPFIDGMPRREDFDRGCRRPRGPDQSTSPRDREGTGILLWLRRMRRLASGPQQWSLVGELIL
jgi:hypothetical protein